MKKRFVVFLMIGSLMYPPNIARADFWGGDIPLLIQIVANTLQQLAQLRAILGNGKDTLGLIREINEGVRQALDLARTMNGTIRPGVFSEFKDVNGVLNAIETLYGMVPDTGSSKLEKLQDQSASEAITLHNQAFKYAETIDPEAERIKAYAMIASPGAASKLTAQSVGVLIHVSNQILRTNAAILKLISENFALQNRHEKLGSQAFKATYEGVSKNMKALTPMRDSSNLNKK